MYRKDFDELVKSYNSELEIVCEKYDSFKERIKSDKVEDLELEKTAQSIKTQLDELNVRYSDLGEIFVEHKWKSYKVYPNTPPEYDFCYENKVEEIVEPQVELNIQQDTKVIEEQDTKNSNVESIGEVKQIYTSEESNFIVQKVGLIAMIMFVLFCAFIYFK